MINFFSKMKSSIIEKSFGESIKAESLSNSMRYLLIFVILIGSMIMIKVDIKLYSGIKDFSTTLATDFPDFELKDGKFYCQGKMPFIKKSGNDIFIIDTTGNTSEKVLEGYKSGCIISESTIIYKKSSVETRSYNLNDVRNFNFTKSQLIGIINNYSIPGLILVFIFGLVIIYIGKLCGVFVLSVISLIINKISNTGLDYQNLFKISIYAIILPTIISVSLDLISIEIPYFWIIYYLIAIYFQVKYMKRYKEDNSDAIISEQ